MEATETQSQLPVVGDTTRLSAQDEMKLKKLQILYPNGVPPGQRSDVPLVAFMPFVVAIVAIIAIVGFRFFRQRETEKTIRAAIEKGVTLDPVIVDRLLGPPRRYSPQRLQTWGIILIFLGIGLAVLHLFVGGPQGRHGPMGPGIMLGIVGIGMIVASRFSKPEQPPQV